MDDDHGDSIVLEITPGDDSITYISAYLADAYDYKLRPSEGLDPADERVSAGLYWDGHGGIIQNRMHGYFPPETMPSTVSDPLTASDAATPAPFDRPEPDAPLGLSSVAPMTPPAAPARAADPPATVRADGATATAMTFGDRAAGRVASYARVSPPTATCGANAAQSSPSHPRQSRIGSHAAYSAVPEGSHQNLAPLHWKHTPADPPPSFIPDPDGPRVPSSSLGSYERNLRLNVGPFDEKDSRKQKYFYTVAVSIFPQNGPTAVHSHDWKVIFYKLILDTAGLSDSWVFGNVPWKDFATVVTIRRDEGGQSSFQVGEEELRLAYISKCAMLWPTTDNDTQEAYSTLSYGQSSGGSRAVRVKQTICALQFEKWVPLQRQVKDFALGVVYAADAPIILNAHDGLMALGRGENPGSRMSPYSPYAEFCKPLTTHLYNQHLIRSQEFWINIRHQTWDADGADYLCFGKYVNRRDNVDYQWQDVLVHVASPESMPGFWGLELLQIRLFKGDEDRLVTKFKQSVYTVVDTGASLSYLPGSFVRKLDRYLWSEYGCPPSLASYEIEDDLMVEFTFGSGAGSIKVVGQALRFLISPLLIRTKTRLPGCDVKEHKRAIFGLNFFRTFAVGFQDGPEPKLSLASHPLVDRQAPGYYFKSAVRQPPTAPQAQGAPPAPPAPAAALAGYPHWQDAGPQPTYAQGSAHPGPALAGQPQQFPFPTTLPAPAAAFAQTPLPHGGFAQLQAPAYPAPGAVPTQNPAPYGQPAVPPQAGLGGPPPLAGHAPYAQGPGYAYPSAAGYAHAVAGPASAGPPAYTQPGQPAYPHPPYGGGQQLGPAHPPGPANPRPKRQSILGKFVSSFRPK